MDQLEQPQRSLAEFNPLFQTADLHNLAAGNLSMLAPNYGPISGTDDLSFNDHISRFTRASIYAAVNELYNIPITVGQWFGSDKEARKISELLAEIDTNLLEYYNQHSDAINTTGFVVSSIIPGLGGIKALNIGQKALASAAKSGQVGGTLSRATGLLAPTQEKNLVRAISEITSSNTPFTLRNKEVLKTLASGFHQQTLEAFAFEVAVGATMFNSPMFTHMDVSDMFWNGIAFGALGGGIGGTLVGVRSIGKIKEGVRTFKKEVAPWEVIVQPSERATPAERFALYILDRDRVPEIPAKTGELAHDALVDKITQIHATTTRAREVEMRKAASDLFNGDQQLAEILWENMKGAKKEDALNVLLGIQSTGRIGSKILTETEIKKLQKSTADVLKATAEDIKDLGDRNVRYFHITGELAGQITETAPTAFRLADTLKPGEKIEVIGNTVKAGQRKKDFHLNKPWSIFAADHLETEMRRIWAKKSAPLPSGFTVDVTDIPLMEKAYRERTPNVNIKLEDGEILKVDSPDVLFRYMAEKKLELSSRLVDVSKLTEDMGTENLIKKLRSDLMIDFEVTDALRPGTLAAYARGLDVQQRAKMTKQIALSRSALYTEPYSRIVQALKHEQGHSFAQALFDSGTFTLQDLNKFRKEMEILSRKMRPDQWKLVDKGDKTAEEYVRYARRHPSDVESGHELFADSFSFAAAHPIEAQKLAPNWWARFGNNVHPIPQELLDAMARSKVRLTQDEIAAMVNVHPAVLRGEVKVGESPKHFMADDLASEEYTARRRANKTLNDPAAVEDIHNVPSVIKIGYKKYAEEVDGNVIDGIALLQARQREYQDAANRVFHAYMPQGFAEKYGDLSTEDVLSVDIFAPGRSAFGSSNQNYTTLGNRVEHLGILTIRAGDAAVEAFKDTANSAMQRLANNQEAAIEWAMLNQRLRGIPENYIPYIAEDGTKSLRSAKLIEYENKVMAAVADGKDPAKVRLPNLGNDIPHSIPVVNDDTWELVQIHAAVDGRRVNAHAAMKSTTGVTESRVPGAFYPIPPDPKNYRHVAFVVDESITGYQRHRMIYAQSQKELDVLISEINAKKPDHWSVYTKKEAEDWYRAIGKFDYEKTLHDVGFDAEIKRRGISMPEFVATDPHKIVDDFLNWHVERERNLVRELVLHKYQPQVDTLRKLGEKYVNVATSVTGSSQSLLKYAETAAANPYADYVKTMIGIPRNQEYAWWFNTQKLLDTTISDMYESAFNFWGKTKSPEELLELDATLRKYGYTGVNYTAAIDHWTNHTAPKAILSTFARKANAVLATLALRLDSLNAINNVVGSHVLYYGEIKSIIRAIEQGDSAVVGKLAELKVKVPGTSEYVLSPTKIHKRAIENYFTALRDPENGLIKKYKDYGYITSISDQYRHILDDLALTGRETLQELNTRMARVHKFLSEKAQLGEKWTGNKFAEEYNRFVAADSARQIMDLGVQAGVITEAEMWANVSTFVRRTQGTYDAFLRPAAFHGPVGQMIGLFQTYQFNLIQQLLRHVSEGRGKDAMVMMALQGSIYGLQGMPAFNAINTHVIGTARGNPENKDIYSTVYQAVGDEAGDWLMYGAATNLLGLINEDLKTNLYVRGDINPRHATILPSSIEDIPIVSATAKIFGGLSKMVSNIDYGGDVFQSFLQGIEHASVNRPLAGLAQLAQSLDTPAAQTFTTTNKGGIVASNDLVSLANFSRILGGRPFDEAVARDLYYRAQVYSAANSDKMSRLSSALKTTLIAGKTPEEDQIVEFAMKYVKMGGKQEDFNKFFLRQMISANEQQIDRMTKTIKSPTMQRLQRQLGGVDPYEAQLPYDSADDDSL